MEKFECDNCKKIYSTKGNLTKHMKTSCKIVKENFIKNSTNSDYIELKKNYDTLIKEKKEIERNKKILETQNARYITKLKNKNNILTKENQDLKLEIVRLETENKIYKQTEEKQFNSIINIANQPKTNTTTYKTNNITIPFDLSDPTTISEMQNKLKINFSKEHLLEGQKGVARLVVENVLSGDDGKNNKYICTDYSRGTFKYKDTEGNTHVDNGGKKLTNVVLEGVKEEVYDIAKVCMDKEEDDIAFGMITRSVIDIKKLKEDNSKFLNEIVALSK